MTGRFDWPTFLDSIGVPWVDSGPNWAPGHVNIKCPWCGNADPSEHMGLRLEDGAWACWRDEQHRGGNPAWLVATLKGITHGEAKELVASGAVPVGVDVRGMRQRAENLGSRREEMPDLETQSFPEEFRAFQAPPKAAERRFHSYLKKRGFGAPAKVARRYGLRWAVTGDWAMRISFPLELRGDLLGWSGRAIGLAETRYDTFPYGPGVKHLLWNFDSVKANPGKVLVLAEGPYDALKLDYYGRRFGMRSVALLGMTMTQWKARLIRELVSEHERTVIMLDVGAEGKAMNLKAKLALLKIGLERVPEGFDDPGELSREEVESLAIRLSL